MLHGTERRLLTGEVRRSDEFDSRGSWGTARCTRLERGRWVQPLAEASKAAPAYNRTGIIKIFV
jgi:hypothetical protein